MLKKRIISVVAGAALMLAVFGASGVVLDSFGVDNPFVGQAAAGGCGTAGGGC